MELVPWSLLLCLIIATAASSSTSDGDTDLLRRLDSLERLVNQQQEQFEREKAVLKKQFQRENEVLKKRFQRENAVLKKQFQREGAALQHRVSALEKDVFTLREDNRSSRKERDSLKAVLEAFLQKPTSDGETRQMFLQEMPLKKTALQTTVSHGDDSFEGDLNPSDPSSSKRRPISTSPLNSTILKHQRQGEELVHRWGGEDREALLYPRSDDQGPLEAVVQQMAQQLTQVTADVHALQNANQVLQTRGSTYTRWGSSSCPHSEDVVYSGVVGGSYYTHTGAAANTLCLSMSPVLRDLPHGRAITQLYGGEYETYDSTHQDRDPSCAVCRSLLSTTIMVPGTDVCSAGWTLEYKGYLMAGYYGHNAATEFVCVDSAMEARAGSDDGHDGHLFYFTKTVCGSLPCPPYEADRVVVCAVCSK